MEVFIRELFVKAIRYPGAMFLSLVTKHDVSYWLEQGSTYGVFFVGAIVITLFVCLAMWASGRSVLVRSRGDAPVEAIPRTCNASLLSSLSIQFPVPGELLRTRKFTPTGGAPGGTWTTSSSTSALS